MPKLEMDESSWVALGFLLVGFGHVVVFVIAVQLLECPPRHRSCAIPEIFRQLALVQLLYVFPAYRWAGRSAHKEIAKGVFIAAGLTVLLSGICWVVR